MGDAGLRFASGGLGVCLQGGAVVTAVGAGLVVVAPPGCRTKSRTERLEIQPCCFALLVVVLVATGIRLFGVSFFVGRSGTMRCAAAARSTCSWTSSSRYLGKLLQRLHRRVFVRLRICWLLYRCRIILYRRLVLVVWLWFGCSKVVVVVVGGGVVGDCWGLLGVVVVVGSCCCWRLLLAVVVGSCCCWLLLLLAFVVSCEGVSFKNKMIE
jgi:hypothetical protein